MLFRSPIVGYAYIGTSSSGPALARVPSDLPRMLTHVAGLFLQNQRASSRSDFSSTGDQYFAVAGTNETVLAWLLECGWQIVFQYLYMSSRPLGRLEHYVCHNPLHFL